MDDDKFRRDLLMRKFDPVSVKPCTGDLGSITRTLKGVVNETVEQAQKQKAAIEHAVSPLAEQAWVKIKDLGILLEDSTIKSSKEARAMLANALQAMADKIRP